MNTSCIHTNYAPDGMGYGRLRFRGKIVKHHRLVYCQYHGIELIDIEGLIVRHTCDNPRCINPQHLELGTQHDNVQDMIARRRQNPPKGEAHYNSKLKEEEVAAIRQNPKHLKQRDLATLYGVSQNVVSTIQAKKTWKE